MNRLTKAALMAASAVLIAQVTHAASSDILLGFDPSSLSGNEADIDLGTAAQLGVGGSSVVDLIDSRGAGFSATGISGTAFQNLLNTALGSTVPNSATMTLAGGQGGTASFYYLGANRGSAGSNPTVPQSTTPFGWTKNQQSTSGGFQSAVITGNSFTGQGGNASVAIGTSGSPNSSSFAYTILGVNNPGTSIASYQTQLPDTAIASGVAYEDVWFNHIVSGNLTGWTYEGYLTLDLTGDTTDLLTFTPVAVPEPSTYGLLAGLGLLAVALRRQFAKA